MAITTTDVCTNVVAGNEVSSNGTIIVSCLPTGSYKKLTQSLRLVLHIITWKAS